MILGRQTGHSHEFPKIQLANGFHGRESPGSKEFECVYLNILLNSAFGWPTHDFHGFAYNRLAKSRENHLDQEVVLSAILARICGNFKVGLRATND